MQIPQFSIVPDVLNRWLAGRELADLCEQYDDQGYLIFENVLDTAQLQKLCGELDPFLEQDIAGRNDFEGVRSNRVYAMLNKSATFAELATHPLALGFAEAELGKSCLLSACLAIQLKPGESAQPWHFDDSHLEIPRPRPAYGLSAFWAIDKTDELNGATEIIPGSHKWSEPSIPGSVTGADLSQYSDLNLTLDKGARTDSIQALLEPGSLMMAKGTLWHRGGANTSVQSRLIITPQYCSGWARQLENMLLCVAPENAAKLSKRAQELIGYSIHPPFMGYVDGMHPRRKLEQ
jgi:ectoine hydroxylase-related dioxygenase (phytanoyl-CoA dioxygenase family)